MSQRYQAAILTASYNGLQVPNAPTIGTATAGAGAASVTFTAPSNVGGSAITSYTVISSPGSILGTGSSSPITVSGLTNGTAYTFTVVATNAYGSGPASAASNSVTPAVNYIENVFSTWLYTGTGVAQTITNGINISGNGGFVWIKGRNAAEPHVGVDTARGASNALRQNSTAASINDAGRVSAFTTSGFTVGTDGETNGSGTTYASWTFREQAKFFDVVTYTGTGSATTIAHNLGSVPGCIIVKSSSNTGDWYIYHRSLGNTQVLNFNTDPAFTGATYWNNTTPTSTVFSVGSGAPNQSGLTYVAYLFAHNAGGFGLTGTDNVISCGSFTTDGSGYATVNLGYEPQWILTKRIDSSSVGQWFIIDNMRGFAQTYEAFLQAQSIASEGTTGQDTYPTATGFQTTGQYTTIGNGTFIYIAIRRGPMAVPTVGTSVFSPLAFNNAQGTQNTTGFAIDSQWINYRPGIAINTAFNDRLRGVSSTTTSTGRYLVSSSAAAEATTNNTTQSWNNTGFQTPEYFAVSNSVYYNFQRAPGFFDEVCYTGTGVARTVTHNLGVAPELMIVKSRSAATYGEVYAAPVGNTKYMYTAFDQAASTGTSSWNNTSPTSTNFTVGVDSFVNANGATFVAWLFATCPGVSKVGSYTGTGATQTIDCGFTGGARFVLVKRTDLAGDWYVWDTARGMVSGTDPSFLLNTTAAEVNANSVYTIATGFQIVSTAAGINASGGTYIFLAIA